MMCITSCCGGSFRNSCWLPFCLLTVEVRDALACGWGVLVLGIGRCGVIGMTRLGMTLVLGSEESASVVTGD